MGEGGSVLLHVTTAEGWAAAQAAGVLGAVPFLHLCTEAQLGFVLERHFGGRGGLTVLEIDPLGLDVRWEASEPGMAPFPHLYGGAALGSVVGSRLV